MWAALTYRPNLIGRFASVEASARGRVQRRHQTTDRERYVDGYDGKRSGAGEVLVRLSGLTRIYAEGERERVVLDGLDAEIRTGEFVVLLGRSGAGKSTLLNLISGIDLPTSGEVAIGGQNLTRLSENERTLFRRRHIGFVFQALNLIPTLTVGENILLPLELNGRMSSEEQGRALSFLREVGLEDRADTFPDRLSGGEQQRVAIARALAHDPLLILADEPTGNLDFRTAAQVMDLLDRLIHRTGKTILVVTHDRDLIGMADRVLELRDGKLVEAEGYASKVEGRRPKVEGQESGN